MERARPTTEGDEQQGGIEAPGSIVHTQALLAGGAFTARAYIALGSNLGDRQAALRRAIAEMARRRGVHVVAVSPVYEAEAHTLAGQPAQPAFLNAVAAIDTDLPPADLLRTLLEVESSMGRMRDGGQWHARGIDLDLVLYGDRVVNEAGLTVPHPRLAERRFVLAPLADLAAEVEVPGTGGTVADLLNACPDTAYVSRTGLEIA